MKRIRFLSIAILLLAWPALFLFATTSGEIDTGTSGASPSPVVKVLLAEDPTAVIQCPADFSVSGRTFTAGSYAFFADGGIVRSSGERFGERIVIRSPSPLVYLSVNGKPYRGTLSLKAEGNRLMVVNHIGLESYLYGVVGMEMPGNNPEALKAQAVASRTLAVNALQKGNLIKATTRAQVYGGVNAERLSSNEAVDDTRGMVLTYNGKLVSSPLFFSTCGGKTEASQDVFGRKIPYLQSVLDSPGPGEPPYCSQAPHFRWRVDWSSDELESSLSRYGVEGEILNLVLAKTDENGRVQEMWVQTDKGKWLIRGFALRQVLKRPDGKPLYSTWFTFQKIVKGGSVYFEADGKGEGHGVGLCQWGAIGMAERGKGFREILSHYYPGTQLADFRQVL